MMLAAAAEPDENPPKRRRSATPSERPNILVVFSDQEQALYDRPGLNTPNRQRLMERGVWFPNTFCTTPQCSASRSSLLTGRYPHQSGVITNVDGNSMGKPLDPTIPNVGAVFAQQGYKTGYLGKWHLGNTKQGLDAFGFQGYKALRGEKLTDAAVEWIGAQDDTPWMLWVSYINPHDIYGRSRKLDDVSLRPELELPENLRDDLAKKPAPQLEFLVND